jgi:hypothetical protein
VRLVVGILAWLTSRIELRLLICGRLEQWYGAPDAGRWTHKNTLRIPDKAKLAKAA